MTLKQNLPKSNVLERKRACGYRINASCASCAFVSHSDRKCRMHNFSVNMDRGICTTYDNIAKYQ